MKNDDITGKDIMRGIEPNGVGVEVLADTREMLSPMPTRKARVSDAR